MDKLEKLFRFLDENTVITLSEARLLGISPMMLSRLAAHETIFRVEHGVYARQMDWLTHPLKKYIVPCTLYPDAVICGVSALSYYNLTDEEERQIWIAFPAPKIIHKSLYRVIRPTGLAYELGIERHTFGKRMVKIYNLEKTVVDAFKYLTEEVALKALKRYLKMKNRNIHKLCDYARRLKKPLDEKIAVLLSDE